MLPVNVQRPLRRGMPQERGTVVLDIRWQLDTQWVLDLWWLQQRRQQRRCREIGDGERSADEIGAAIALLLDPVEGGAHGGAIVLESAFTDPVAKAVVRREDPRH